MTNQQAGKFTDSLKYPEVVNTRENAKILSESDNWVKFLENPRLKKAINVEPKPSRPYDELNLIKSTLFEIRFACLIHRSGLIAEYEFNPNSPKNKKGQQQKTIDFKINAPKNINLLVELSSLRESELQKSGTWENNEFFECCLNEEEEVAEYFKAQNVLIEKAKKIPSEIIPNQYNIIILDMRSSILNCSDYYDYHNILYGGKGLNPAVQHYTKDNDPFPGIFCSTHPLKNDLEHLHKNIHYFGFVVETEYTPNELANKINWLPNPNYLKLPNLKEIFRV